MLILTCPASLPYSNQRIRDVVDDAVELVVLVVELADLWMSRAALKQNIEAEEGIWYLCSIRQVRVRVRFRIAIVGIRVRVSMQFGSIYGGRARSL